MRRLVARWIWAGLAWAAGGCGMAGSQPPLRPEAFVRNPPGMRTGLISKPVDENGTVIYGELRAPLLPEEYTNHNPNVPAVIEPRVRRAVPATQPLRTAAVPAAPAATIPATQSFPTPPSTYEVVGTVVMIVNGTPIYADKVVSSIQAELSADARRLDASRFRQDAARKIYDRVEGLRYNYLEVAAANQALSAEDKLQADNYATVFRNQLIAAAGGSVELARQQALENGQTLEEQIKDKRDATLVQLYYQRFVVPKIQVSAQDMRNYYQQNLAAKFSKAAAAKFRLIKIDVARSGGPERALAKAKEILRQLKGGVDFATLASQYNDNEALMRSGGDVGWIQKGNFFSDEIENAVWKLHPGEITDAPIEVRGANGAAFYVAQLEALKPGTVQPFDNDQVQESIRNDLFDAQFRVLREKRLRDLERQAITFRVPQGIDAAIDIAMQRYPAWAAAK